MTRFITLSALTAALIIGAAADANAWTRAGSVVGPRGMSSVQASANCANGTCSRSITRTGPYGNSVTRQATVSCGGGACTGSRQTTGPYGRTVYRQGTVTR